jgi:hypothetical protein
MPSRHPSTLPNQVAGMRLYPLFIVEASMSDVLKGNFKPRDAVKVEKKPLDLNAQFEREALKRLGGSIAFVSKKKFLYGLEHNDEPTS